MKKKWANLRDSFATQRRTYEARLASGAAASPEPKWSWWQAFQWFRDATHKRRYLCYCNCFVIFNLLIFVMCMLLDTYTPGYNL